MVSTAGGIRKLDVGVGERRPLVAPGLQRLRYANEIL